MKKILYKLVFAIICISLVNICNIAYASSYLTGESTTQTTPYAPGQQLQEEQKKKEEEQKKQEEEQKKQQEEQKKQQEQEIQKQDTTTTKHTLGEIIHEGDKFIQEGESNPKIEEENLKSMSDTIYGILLTLGIIIAFAIGGILGIKFITEGIEGKAEVKAMLIPYILGCIILFGAFTIWNIIVTILRT